MYVSEVSSVGVKDFAGAVKGTARKYIKLLDVHKPKLSFLQAMLESIRMDGELVKRCKATEHRLEAQRIKAESKDPYRAERIQEILDRLKLFPIGHKAIVWEVTTEVEDLYKSMGTAHSYLYEEISKYYNVLDNIFNSFEDNPLFAFHLGLTPDEADILSQVFLTLSKTNDYDITDLNLTSEAKEIFKLISKNRHLCADIADVFAVATCKRLKTLLLT